MALPQTIVCLPLESIFTNVQKRTLTGERAAVFAPTDNAFEKIPDKAPKPSKEELKKILLYHVSEDFYPAGKVLVTHTIPTLLSVETLGIGPQRLATEIGLKGLTVNFYSRIVAIDIVCLPIPIIKRTLTPFSLEPTASFMALTAYLSRHRRPRASSSSSLASSVPWNSASQRPVSCPLLQTPQPILGEPFSPLLTSPSRSWAIGSTASSLALTVRNTLRLFWHTTSSPIRHCTPMLTTRLNQLVTSWKRAVFPRVTST